MTDELRTLQDINLGADGYDVPDIIDEHLEHLRALRITLGSSGKVTLLTKFIDCRIEALEDLKGEKA